MGLIIIIYLKTSSIIDAKIISQKLRGNSGILSGSIDTYSVVVIGPAVYVIEWQRDLYRIKPFDENPTWEYLKGPKKFHGAEPPAVILNGFICVCGGGFAETDVYRKTREIRFPMTKTCEKYNPAVGQWEKFKDVHCEKRLNAMVQANGYIFSIGGIGRENELFEDTKMNIKQENDPPGLTHEIASSVMERYDEESDEWSIMPPMRKSRIAPAVTGFNGKIYVLGGGGVKNEGNPRLADGFDNRHYLCSVEFFDLNSNEWVLVNEEMMSPRMKFRACVFDDIIYAMGGNNRDNSIIEQANIRDISGEADVEDEIAKVWKVTDWIGEMSKWNYMATLLLNVPTEEMQVD